MSELKRKLGTCPVVKQDFYYTGIVKEHHFITQNTEFVNSWALANFKLNQLQNIPPIVRVFRSPILILKIISVFPKIIAKYRLVPQS